MLGAIVAVLSLLAAFQSPVQINTHANSTSITKSERMMSCTHLSDLCALLQTRLCEGRRALLCLLLLSSSQETRLFKQLLQQLIITLNTHKRLLLLCFQMREGDNNSVCVFVVTCSVMRSSYRACAISSHSFCNCSLKTGYTENTQAHSETVHYL